MSEDKKRTGIPRMLTLYKDKVAPSMREKFKYKNALETPRVTKVVVAIGMGEATKNANALQAAERDLASITGQKPIECKAKQSVSNFSLRAGQTIGLMTTLRGRKMWDFLDRLFNIVLPRLRDFRGTSRKSFDKRGNYSLGLREQAVFPEIDYNEIDKLRGLQVSIVTTSKTDDESMHLLELLGMPFAGSPSSKN